MEFHYEIAGDDWSNAGHASSSVKKKLKQLNVPAKKIKSTAIAMYEAEINMVIHANGGICDVLIGPSDITIQMKDEGPGIPDVEKAMTEGFTTASEAARELGFGAGMGLPNMKKHADEMSVDSVVGQGTTVTLKLHFDKE